MKASFEFKIQNNDDFVTILLSIDKFLLSLEKIILTCSCGATTESGIHLASSPEEQSDKDCDFIKEHINCKGDICLTKSQIN